MRPFTLVLLAAAACLAPAVDAALTGPTLAEDAATVDPEMAALVRELGSAGTRVAAARKLVTAGEKAVPALVAVLKDDLLAEHALDVLAKLGPAAKGAVGALSPLVKQWNYKHRPLAAGALGAIGAEASSAVANLTAYLSESVKSAGRDEAAAALAAIASDDNRRARKPAPPNEVDLAISAGWDWLIRHQTSDGGWDADGFKDACKGAACSDPGEGVYDVGLTGLAVLALLEPASAVPPDGARLAAVRAAVAWIEAKQSPTDGTLGTRQTQHWIYNHTIAALALLEAARRGGPASAGAADRAVALVLEAQNPHLAWRYGIRDGSNDTSVTAWATRVLDAGRRSGVPVPVQAFDDAESWVEKMTDPATGRTGYATRGSGPARTLEMLDRYPPDASDSMTACGLHVHLAAHAARGDDAARRGAPPPPPLRQNELFVRSLASVHRIVPDRARNPGGVDLYYWLQAAPLVRTIGGPEYVAWRKGLVASLAKYQDMAPGSCSRGSWGACDPWGPEGGRIYTTAAAVIALCEMREDPATRPAPTSVAKRVIAALEKGEKDPEPGVADACRSGLRKVRDTCK